jgi:hypothetical protein
MDRPPGGWSDLVTNQTLTDKLDALRQEMRAELAGLRAELSALSASVDNRLRHEVKAETSALSASVENRLRKQTWVVTTSLLSGVDAATAVSTAVAALP